MVADGSRVKLGSLTWDRFGVLFGITKGLFRVSGFIAHTGRNKRKSEKTGSMNLAKYGAQTAARSCQTALLSIH